MAQPLKTRTVSAFISKHLGVTNLPLLIATVAFPHIDGLHCRLVQA